MSRQGEEWGGYLHPDVGQGIPTDNCENSRPKYSSSVLWSFWNPRGKPGMGDLKSSLNHRGKSASLLAPRASLNPALEDSLELAACHER